MKSVSGRSGKVGSLLSDSLNGATGGNIYWTTGGDIYWTTGALEAVGPWVPYQYAPDNLTRYPRKKSPPAGLENS